MGGPLSIFEQKYQKRKARNVRTRLGTIVSSDAQYALYGNDAQCPGSLALPIIGAEVVMTLSSFVLVLSQ